MGAASQWTPVDESADLASKWTPVEEPAKAQPSWMSRAWNAANKGLISGDTLMKMGAALGPKPPDQKQGESTRDYLTRVQNHIDSDHPYIQALRTFVAGSAKDAYDTASGFTSPLSLGTMGAAAATKIPGAVGAVAKGITGAAGAGFAAAGAGNVSHAISDDSQPLANRVQEGLQGGAMIAGGAAGAGAAAKGLAAAASNKAEGLYKSALKPSVNAKDVPRAINTALEEGIPVSKGGLQKLSDLKDALDEQITRTINSSVPMRPPIRGLLPAAPVEVPLAAQGVRQMPGGLVPATRPEIPDSAFSPDARIARGDSGLSPIRLTDAETPDAPYRYYATKGNSEIPNAGQSEAGVMVTRDPRIINGLSGESTSAPYRLPNGKTIDPDAVVQRLDALKSQLSKQVNPDADLQAIEAAKQEFLRNNPGPMSAVDAQATKVGTYQRLRDKYGELQSGTIEAQKALARGIKEELETQFPELQQTNARYGNLLSLEPLLEKAVARIGNHQMMGIDTPLTAGAAKAVTGSAPVAAVAAILKAVVDDPFVKSRMAISLNKSGVTLSGAYSRLGAYSNALAAASSSASNDTQQRHNAQ